jgi:hypothetical protein
MDVSTALFENSKGNRICRNFSPGIITPFTDCTIFSKARGAVIVIGFRTPPLIRLPSALLFSIKFAVV